jgi:outer membrane protein TolC
MGTALGAMVAMSPVVVVAGLGGASGCASAESVALDRELAALARDRGLAGEPVRAGPGEGSEDDTGKGLDGEVDARRAVALVLARNPRLDAMRAAWAAMQAEVTVARALPEPTLEVGISPLSLPSGRGQKVGLSWPLSWPGLVDARGRAALGAAVAGGHEVAALRIELGKMAAELVWEVGLAQAVEGLWHEHHRVLETLRQGALARFSTGRGAPEDAVRADAELAMAERDVMEARRMGEIAKGQLNALMHRAPDAPLVVAPLPTALPPSPPELAVALEMARARRPELSAARARVDGLLAGVQAAEKETRPMMAIGVEVSTMPDDAMMWPMLTFMVGLPLDGARRDAEVEAAKARVDAARGEARALEDSVAGEVARWRSELVLALELLGVTDGALVPARLKTLDLAMAGYAAGRKDFELVVMAASELLEARIGRVRLVAQAYAAATRLEAALGAAVRETERAHE